MVIKLFFIFCLLLGKELKASDILLTPDRIKDISYRQSATRTVANKDGKMTLRTDNINEIFHIPPKVIYTEIPYLGQFKIRISDSYKTFVEQWIRAKYLSSEVDLEDEKLINSIALLNREQINMFYEEMVFVYRGKSYELLVQKPVAIKMRQQLKTNDKTTLEIVLLGYSAAFDKSFGVVSNFGVEKKFKSNSSYNSEITYNVAKVNLQSRKFDLAIAKFKEILAKNPNDIQLQNDICAAEHMKMIYTNVYNKFTAVENCYKEIVKKQDSAEAYYGLASLAYIDKNLNVVNRAKQVLNYSTKAINLIGQKTTKPTNSEMVVYYNSLYLRGIAKLELKEATAYEDLNLVEKERPDLINLNFLTR